MVRVFTMTVAMALVAGILSAQWLATFPVLPHAPLHDCQQHQCGCPPEMTARKMCCCFPAGDTGMDTLRSAECDGRGSGQAMTFSKLHWVIVKPVGLSFLIGPVAHLEPVTLTLRTRSTKPPVPPPRVLLAV